MAADRISSEACFLNMRLPAYGHGLIGTVYAKTDENMAPAHFYAHREWND